MASPFAARVKKAWRALTDARAPARPRQHMARMYAAARSSRLTADWNPSTSSADLELVGSLTLMRSRARALIRDAAYAKRARGLVVNNVIGTGIGMQARVMTSRDKTNERVNDAIEEAWEDWGCAESCHMGGRLAFSNLERTGMSQVFDAGEVFIRKHHRTMGRSEIPFSLELIEAERIADQLDTSALGMAPGNQIRMGVEVDQYFRPVAYYIRAQHPSEIRFSMGPDMIERVPADQIIHLAVIDRWPQTRGEPWLHAVMRRLNDADGYSEAEIIRARVQATTVGAIETPEDIGSFGEEQSDGSAEMEMEPGVYKRLNPGEKLNAQAPTSPNPGFGPFMTSLMREICAGSGVSYASLSMDYSQSNYSSSRMALLDDRDIWRFYQAWFICDFREIIHREWLQAAMLVGAIPAISINEYAVNPKKFEAVRFKPRGWSWIDPSSEVDAYNQAIKSGMTTLSDVINKTGDGRDIEDVLIERERELAMMKAKGLVFDTSPEVYTADAEKLQAEADAAARPPPTPNPAPQDTQTAPNEPAPQRVLRIQR